MTGTPEDVTDLIQLVNRLFMSADVRDWQAYRSLMTEEVTLDFGGVGPHATGTRGADQVARDAERVIGPVYLTQHMVSNHLVSITGDEASVEFYEHALHYHPALGSDETINTWVLYGHGVRTARRTGDGWRLTGAVLTIRHQTGNPGLLTDVAAMEA